MFSYTVRSNQLFTSNFKLAAKVVAVKHFESENVKTYEKFVFSNAALKTKHVNFPELVPIQINSARSLENY